MNKTFIDERLDRIERIFGIELSKSETSQTSGLWLFGKTKFYAYSLGN